MSEDDPLVGAQISSYAILRRIGRGGMGVVYQARHATLEREVAIKFLAAEFAMQPSYVERFLREARAAARLHHPNIIIVHDAGSDGGRYYFVMEYVEGKDLGRLLRDGGALAEGDVIRHGLQAAAALAYAHQAGIVHRDIKPENLIRTNAGEIKIADLGLAKQIDQPDGSLTLSGVVIGTPYYISPEQIRGSRNVDGRTDIYSLGATLYHLVTGRLPHRGSSAAEIMSKHLTEPFCWPQTLNPSLSEGFSRTLYRMMAKEPEERFRNMEEVVRVFEELKEGRMPSAVAAIKVPQSVFLGPGAPPAPAGPIGEAARVPPVIAPPLLPRRRGRALKIGCLILALAAGTFIFLAILGGLIEEAKKKKAGEAAGEETIVETDFEDDEPGKLPADWSLFVQEFDADGKALKEPEKLSEADHSNPDGSRVSAGIFPIEKASQESRVLRILTRPAPGASARHIPWLRRVFPVQAGQNYELVFHARAAETETQATLEIEAPGQPPASSPLTLKNEWQEVRRFFKPSEDGEAAFSITPSREAEIWLDLVSVKTTREPSPPPAGDDGQKRR